jgi:quinol monooxygenase YgiN
MILVIGTAVARPDRLDELLALSLEHVRRSRTEPGCLEHGVHQDSEDPCRLVFVERWSDRAALLAHFAVPASGAFVRAATALCAETPAIRAYEATEISLR